MSWAVKNRMRTYRQDDGVGKHCACLFLRPQLYYRTSVIENRPKTSWTGSLKLRIYTRSHTGTNRRGRDVKEAGATPRCVVKNQEGYLAGEIPPEVWGVLDPRWASQTGTPVLGRGVPRIPGCGNQRGPHWRDRAARDVGTALERLVHGLTSSGLRCRGSSSKGARNIQGGTDKFQGQGQRGRGSGAAPSRDGNADEHHCSFVVCSSLPDGRHHIWVSINLTSMCPALVILGTHSTQFVHPAQTSSSGFSTQAALAHSAGFPKISQRPTNPKQTAAGLSMPCTSC